ncbi:hypothetical protein H9Q13_13190 [Pontibacter sp. JH31]|uniref:Uncharacterized protein n=1 Tax=Pontibacter aquaedesilientis TaxID=2766980 RepID=A0ABR7XIQ5_9BACT|nr:hypothetical protein [Pontibacter aquaedesilientis]MBD1398123.1 hypothetical protein [Pontibacter aquaedesilientis]
MKTTLLTCLTAACLLGTSCNTERGKMEADESEATMASETGAASQLGPDVIYVTKPLIGGEVYKTASFQATSLVYFDTTQLIQVLDTLDAIFVKARVQKDTTMYTGFVSKAILPE